MLSDEKKCYILNEHLRNIASISNKAYQQRVWIQGKGPEVDSFDETVCHFFDDGDPILENYKDYKISDSQHSVLKYFRDKFEEFVDSDHPYLEKDFIDTPEWTAVTEMAQQVLIAFGYNNK